MKITILSFILLGIFNEVSCQIIEGATNSAFFKSGATKPTVFKIANGELVNMQFKQFAVEVTWVKGTTGQNLINVPEDESWSTMQISEFDFEKDGINELIVGYGDGLSSLEVTIFKKINNEYKVIGEFSGQEKCELSKNKIIAPYGSQGLYSEYVLTRGKFVETQL